MNEELARFVAALAIPEDRKAVVLAELVDHATCAADAAVRDGLDPEAAWRAAVGDFTALRRALEAVEPAFRYPRWLAVVRGIAGGLVLALAIDQGGALMRGLAGVVLTLLVAIAFAPPRALELLRGELRAGRVAGRFGIGGPPIGPAVSYAFAVMSSPFVAWIALIVVRGFRGVTEVDVPYSAFSICFAVYGLLLVEGIRARRRVET